MVFEELLKNTGEWLRGQGPEGDIVISSRVRLARNLRAFRFITRMDAEERTACEERIKKQIFDAKLVPDERFVDLMETSPLDRKLLVERHLISKEQEDARHPRAVAIGNLERVSIMINEEDHIRLQVLQAGLSLRDTFSQAVGIDEKLEEGLEYAFSPQLGYLTACPTNVGTGMRVSVMLHLPGLVMTRHVEKVFQAVSKMNLAVRGLYGEGTEASGHFYQISNQVTLGKSEDEIVRTVEEVIPAILRYERKAREDMMKKDRVRLEDRVFRAFGQLSSARIMSSEESMMLLSAVRMGVHLGLFEKLTIEMINELFLYSQPAHLQRLAGKALETSERDMRRAEYIRKRLKELGA